MAKSCKRNWFIQEGDVVTYYYWWSWNNIKCKWKTEIPEEEGKLFSLKLKLPQ